MGITRVAIFASGSGTNAEEFFKYFKGHKEIAVVAVFSNNPNAYVLARADNWHVDKVVFNRKELYESNEVLESLSSLAIDFICLAGFMWLVPDNILQAYSGKIINIHPSLLPAHGGKGMYGDRVHQAVLGAGEKESGITIHFVNGQFDEGEVIFQAKCEVKESDTAETLANRIHVLEYAYYPKVAESTILKKAPS